MNKTNIEEYVKVFGKQAAADLLLLIGPDNYNGDDYDDLLNELKH